MHLLAAPTKSELAQNADQNEALLRQDLQWGAEDAEVSSL